jgi:hypothetical protein
MKKIIGKTIASLTKRSSYSIDDGKHEIVRIMFTDGTSLKIQSWDYEGYKSGVDLKMIGKRKITN